MKTKLFVVGFPRELEEIELNQLFTLHALVKKLIIVRDMQTGVSKGYAFVDMIDIPGAERAIAELDGMAFGERIMSVRFAEQQQNNDEKSNQSLAFKKGFIKGDFKQLPEDSSKHRRPRRINIRSTNSQDL